jgi:hypothetical protein
MPAAWSGPGGTHCVHASARAPSKALAGNRVAIAAADLQDLVSLLLDAAQALLEGAGAGEVLDADAQQRQRRHLQQLSEAPDRFQLDHLALFVAVEGRARHAEAGRDLLARMPDSIR